MGRKELAEVVNSPCLVCKRRPVDAAHIRTKKASGINERWNYMPLCREHHSEQHTIGIITFIKKYVSVFYYVQDRGWSIDVVNGKELLRRTAT